MTNQLQGTSLAIYNELKKRNIPVVGYKSGGVPCIAFHYAGRMRFITGSSPDVSSGTGRSIADDKELTNKLLVQSGEFDQWLAPSMVVGDAAAAEQFLKEQGVVVVKPIDAAHGDGVTTNIRHIDELQQAVKRVQQYARKEGVLLQRHIEGNDYRLIVIDGEVVAVIQRCPAEVWGDGVQTIRELIDRDNATNPRRGQLPHEKSMDLIDLEAVRAFLSDAELRCVPPDGARVQVTGVANISSGGYAIECLNEIPDEVKRMAVQVTEYFGLFICGVDIMAPDNFRGAKLIEINASPGLMPYYDPLVGMPANVPAVYVDKLLAAYKRAAS